MEHTMHVLTTIPGKKWAGWLYDSARMYRSERGGARRNSRILCGSHAPTKPKLVVV